jgi:hypothetical protein
MEVAKIINVAITVRLARRGETPDRLSEEDVRKCIAEMDGIFDRLRGNRAPETLMSPADKALALESALRRAVEMIDEADKET